jgi:hypothetical protein
MRICAIGMVKNEADIIEAFVRHTLTFADHLCLLENASSDDTRPILDALMAEGLPLTVIDDPLLMHVQGLKMRWLYRRIVPILQPDFVLLLDADEFILAPGRAAFEAALATIPPDGFGLMRWRNYVLRPEEMDGRENDPPRRIRHRLRDEHDHNSLKAIIRCDVAPPEVVQISQGNHYIRADRPLRGQELPDIRLAHFPVRSLEQMRRKAVMGWIAYAGFDQRVSKAMSLHWRRHGGSVAEGAALGPQDALAMNLYYAGGPAAENAADLDAMLVEDAFPAGYALRIPRQPPLDVLATVARAFANHLADDRFKALLVEIEAARARAWRPKDPPRVARSIRTGYFDLGPLRQLLDRLRPGSLLHMPAGHGAAALDAVAAGVPRVLAVDAADPDAVLLAGRYLQHDPATPLDLGERFDMVVSLGQLGALDEAGLETLADSLVRHAGRRILFAPTDPEDATTPEQAGAQLLEMLPLFLRRGWQPVVAETEAARLAASVPDYLWGLVVLGPATAPDRAARAWVEAASARLFAIWPDRLPPIDRRNSLFITTPAMKNGRG